MDVLIRHAQYIHRFIWTSKLSSNVSFCNEIKLLCYLLLTRYYYIFKSASFDTNIKLNYPCFVKAVVLFLKIQLNFSDMYRNMSWKVEETLLKNPDFPPSFNPPPNCKVRKGLRRESCRFIAASHLQAASRGADRASGLSESSRTRWRWERRSRGPNWIPRKSRVGVPCSRSQRVAPVDVSDFAAPGH